MGELPTFNRVLAVVAHPDDETWACGGTLARLAAGGAAVEVLSLTSGDGGTDLSEDGADLSKDGAQGGAGATLGMKRRGELAAASEALGLAQATALGFVDGALGQRDEGAALGAVLAALNATRPELVITLGRDGGYGHRDHTACTALVEQAVALSAHQALLWLAVFPPHRFDRLCRGLRRHRPELMDPAVRPPLGQPREDVQYVVNIDDFAEAKLRALTCHRSQLPAGDPHRFLWPGFIDAMLTEEWFVEVSP